MPDEVLKSLISYAYNNVPYYKKLFDDKELNCYDIDDYNKLKKIPYLTKKDIQNNHSLFISKEYKKYPKNSELLIRRTSGSSGKSLKVYWSSKDNIRSMMQLWIKRNNFSGINPQDKFCTFHTTVYSKNKLVDSSEILNYRNDTIKSFSKLELDSNRIEKYYKEMIEFQPVWLFIQPSIAYLIADFMEQNCLKSPESLKYIELTGEYLFSYQKHKISKVFKVPLANQYGCNEVNSIAYECEYGHLHVLENNVYVEVVEDNERVIGKEGEIFITGLTNKAMPFIRYAIGDRGILHNDIECKCGSKSPILEVLTGRTSDYVTLTNNQCCNSYIFLYPIEHINENMGYPIKQFKIIQEDINRFKVLLSLKACFEGWKKSISEKFVSKAKEIGLKNIEWKFAFVNEIYPDINTGKLSFYENRIKKG